MSGNQSFIGGPPPGPGGPGWGPGWGPGRGGPPPGRFGGPGCCLGEACCAFELLGCLSPFILFSSLKALLVRPRRNAGVVRGEVIDPHVPRGWTARRLYHGVRFYQRQISPRLRPCCRYSPSCSHYALDALRGHGALRGSWLTARRLLRCRPGSGGGVDPVPPRR